MAREVRVAILGDSRDFSRAVSSASHDAGRLEGAFSKVGSFAKTAAIGLGAVAVGAGALAKGFVDAAYESQKVTKQTEAVLTSMGLAAGVSAENIADLATSMSLASGIDDELIQSGMNVMLTFGNVASSAQEVGGVFDQASQAALDMSVALGMDMKSAAMMVGKALNDPIKGLTALRRSGIQFTAQQEDQIKKMVEAGNVTGAQTIMLKELEKQFGGSAAAQATAADKLKVAWGNVQEELGAKLIPVIEKVATWLAAHLPNAMAQAQAFMDNTLIPAFQRVSGFVQENWPKVRDAVVSAVEGIQAVATPIIGALVALWDNFGNNILSFVQRVWPAIQQVIEGALAVIRGVITTVTALIQGDWSRVWEGVKGIVWGVWNAIQGIVRTALESIQAVLGVGLEIIGSVFKSAWNGIMSWFSGLPGQLGDIASRAWNALKNGLAEVISWIIAQIDRALGPLDELLGGLAKAKGFLVGDIDWQAKIDGARAGGGPITAGSWLVGERGPEIVTVGSPGFVTPNHALGGGPEVINLVVDGKVLAKVVRDHDRGLR